MMIRQLFAGLWDRGAVVVATSNRPPVKLYHNGLQRAQFLPFIKQLEERTCVHSLEASLTDYRLLKVELLFLRVCVFSITVECSMFLHMMQCFPCYSSLFAVPHWCLGVSPERFWVRGHSDISRLSAQWWRAMDANRSTLFERKPQEPRNEMWSG